MSSDALPDDPGTLKAMLLAERMQNERLRQIIKDHALKIDVKCQSREPQDYAYARHLHEKAK